MLKCYLIENEWDTTSTGLMSQIQNWAKAMSQLKKMAVFRCKIKCAKLYVFKYDRQIKFKLMSNIPLW